MPENRASNIHGTVFRKKKKRYNPFRLSLILMFYIASIVVSFFIYATNFDISSKPSESYHSDSASQQITADQGGIPAGDDGGNTPADAGDSSPLRPEGGNPVPESAAKPDSYFEKCMFIGDSITTGLSGYKLVPSENVFADVGLRIDNINQAVVKNPKFEEPVGIMQAIETLRPENVYVLLGSNGVAWYNNDSMLESYGEFIDSIKTKLPDSKVYIISLTPVGKLMENSETNRVLNSEIDSFNERLLRLADQKNVHYIDVNSELKDSSGRLPDDVTTDGMHFKLDVYKKFVNYILTHTAE